MVCRAGEVLKFVYLHEKILKPNATQVLLSIFSEVYRSVAYFVLTENPFALSPYFEFSETQDIQSVVTKVYRYVDKLT